jgi:putative DNA primase/helicase
MPGKDYSISRPKKATLKRSAPRDSAIEFYNRRTHPLICHRDTFYQYLGTRYREISERSVIAELYTFLAGAVVKIPPSGDETEWTEMPFLPNDRDVKTVLPVLQPFEGKVFVADDLEPPAWLHGAGNKPDPKSLIVLKNWIVNLETSATFPHSADFFTTTGLPFEYDPGAKCPRWERFVVELFPDNATRRELQKAVGYLLSSDRTMQKVFLVIGPQRSGKGTLMHVLTALLGKENTISCDLNDMGSDFGKAQLINKKAAFFTDERLRGDTSAIVRWLLKLSGEDDVSIQRKYKDVWQGRPSVRLWISSNETPSFDDASGVIASRFIVFRLTQSFLGREDLELESKLLAELPGIFNWAMEGLRMLREDGKFKLLAQTEEDAQRMRDIASPVLAFARHRLIVCPPDKHIEIAELYEGYVDWCKANGHRSQSCPKFIGTLKDDNPGKLKEARKGPRSGQVRVLQGIGWQHEGDFVLPANDDDMGALRAA